MKIAFFNTMPLEYGGGTANYFIEVSTALKKRYPELDISILSFDKSFSKKILSMYSFYFFNKYDNNLHKESSEAIKKMLPNVSYHNAKSISKLRKILQAYDVIYSKNDFVEAWIIKVLLGYKNLPPVIYGFHTPVFYPITKSLQSRLHNGIYNSFLYRYLLKNSKKLHVLNSYDEQLMTKFFDKKTVVKIYNPFHFAIFKNQATKQKYPIHREKNKLHIAWVGRITEQKGIDDLEFIINAVNNSAYKNTIIWNIAGDGELKNKIITMAKHWNNVFYYGYIPHNAIANMYGQNDILLSTSKWESFPYNILEAQSFGLPVICYNIQGCRDIIDNGINGLLVKDTYAFIDAIMNYRKGKFEKANIRSYIRKKFNAEDSYKKLYQLFNEKSL